MNKYALIAVDSNPSYLYLLPFICKSWHLQGWNIQLSFNNVLLKHIDFFVEILNKLKINTHIQSIIKISTTQNKALYTQCERLYMGKDIEDVDYAIITDVDMFIASDFLNRDYDKVNAFGYDLTGYTQVPMCYVGMTGKKWKELMNPFDVEKDLATFADKNSTDFYRAWGNFRVKTEIAKKVGISRPTEFCADGIFVHDLMKSGLVKSIRKINKILTIHN